MDNRGTGIIEVLVSMTILLIILGITYASFNSLLKGFKRESKSIETQIDRATALELIRLDLEHAGYGIATDCNDTILELNGTSLTIRSTINNSNEATRGWVIKNCIANSTLDQREDTTNDDLVYLTLANKTFVSNSDINTCPGSDIYIGFPYDSTASTTCASNGQHYNSITYSLSSSQSLSRCHPGTKNLLRSVNGGTGAPILNCVADVALRFDLDTNGDGVVDTNASSSLPTSNDAIRSQLKAVRVYLLIQEGQKDQKYTFTGSTTLDGITLSRPANSDNYRWKIIKLVVKPLNL